MAGARLAFVCTMAIAIGGCSDAATLHLRDGRTLEGPIIRSDTEHVVVEREVLHETSASAVRPRRFRQRTRVPRALIVDIEHPGGPEIVAGACLTGLGGAAILVGVIGAVANSGKGGHSLEHVVWLALGGIPGGALLIAGIPTLVVGLGTRATSQERAGDTDETTAPRPQLPLPQGASVVFRF